MKVFLSSTFIDLIEHRKEVAEALTRLGHHVIGMETFNVRKEDPKRPSLKDVEGCDLFIGIYAHRYGLLMRDSDVSAIEQEFDYALKKRKKIFAFIVDEDYPWPPKMIEKDVHTVQTLKDFKKKIIKYTTPDYFRDKTDLAYKVVSVIKSKALDDSSASHANEQTKHQIVQLDLLQRISNYIQDADELEKIFHTVLTGVTSGFGLGFNRAAIFLLDQKGELLEGVMGIGYIEGTSAYQDWSYHHRSGLDDFERYLEILETNSLPDTPINKRIQGLKIPLNFNSPDTLTRVVTQQRWILANQEDINNLPENFKLAFEPTLPLVFVPLRIQNQVLGVLVSDNKFDRVDISQENISMLTVFANSVAMLIRNVQLTQKIEATKGSNSIEQGIPDVFVLMPFAKQYQRFYKDVVKNTVEKMGLTCKRADDFFRSSVIMNDIMHCIGQAGIIIADFSGRNPNVFFEVGIAHSLGKNVILITQNLEDVPPKLQMVRCHIYEDNLKGAKEFPNVLRRAIDEAKGVNTSIFSEKKFFDKQGYYALAIMPSNEQGNQTYTDLVHPLLKNLNIACIRNEDIFDYNSILDQTWERINKAEILVIDLTDKDPDVFYLAGLAFGLNKRIIFISQRKEDIPFDFKSGSSLIYSLKTYAEGKSAEDKLLQIIKNILDS